MGNKIWQPSPPWNDIVGELRRIALEALVSSRVSESWLADRSIELRALTWHEDEFGPYWVAGAWRGQVILGITGSYYDVGPDGKRAPREEQEAELRDWGKLEEER